jgi:hypothetical protein
MKVCYGVLLVLFASAMGRPLQAQSKAEHDAALRAQGMEDQIANLYDRIRDLDEDRKAAEMRADEAENRAALADGETASPNPSVAASARAAASNARQAAANERSRVRSDNDEIVSLTRQIQELKYAEANDSTPQPDARHAVSTDPLVGSWNLNLARSTVPSGVPKEEIRDVEAAKGGIQSFDTTVYTDGRTIRSHWTAKYDGKDYPITQDGARQTISISRASDHFFNFKIKENGRVVSSGQIVCSPDGKSQTIAGTHTDGAGAQTQFVTVWDRR